MQLWRPENDQKRDGLYHENKLKSKFTDKCKCKVFNNKGKVSCKKK